MRTARPQARRRVRPYAHGDGLAAGKAPPIYEGLSYVLT